MKLKPVRYEYKADNAIGLKLEGEHIRFGAAAVGEVIPETMTRVRMATSWSITIRFPLDHA